MAIFDFGHRQARGKFGVKVGPKAQILGMSCLCTNFRF